MVRVPSSSFHQRPSSLGRKPSPGAGMGAGLGEGLGTGEGDGVGVGFWEDVGAGATLGGGEGLGASEGTMAAVGSGLGAEESSPQAESRTASTSSKERDAKRSGKVETLPEREKADFRRDSIGPP